MSPSLLDTHRLIATTDLAEARAAVAARFCDHQLRLTQRHGRLDMVQNAVVVGGDVTLNYLRYGDEVRITPGTFDDFFLVQVPLTGAARVSIGRHAVASDRRRATVGSPTEPVDMVWGAGCEQLLVYMRRGAVEALAAEASEEPPTVVFDPLVDLGDPAIRSWMRLVSFAVEDIEASGSLLRSPLAAAHFAQTIIAGFLEAQTNNAMRVTGSREPGARAVRVVAELIEARPDVPWTIAELSRCGGVSVRTLQESFRRDLGVSPLAFLRRVRLQRAHRDLVAGSPDSTTVSDIALRWGFAHHGRFAGFYRDMYRETPRETLAR